MSAQRLYKFKVVARNLADLEMSKQIELINVVEAVCYCCCFLLCTKRLVSHSVWLLDKVGHLSGDGQACSQLYPKVWPHSLRL